MTAARSSLVALVLLVASPLLAAGLSEKYKTWPSSPQGYFMTAAERAQWKSISSDADAEKFVSEFIARRGGAAFTDDVAHNAAQADKYLTVGKTPGSATLRGKMMIILGPPGSITAAKKKASADFRSTADGYISAGGLDSTGPSVGEMAQVAQAAGMSEKVVTEFTYTYAADKLPPSYGKPLTVKIEVDAYGRDAIASYATQKELERIYEIVAQSRVTPAPAPPAQ